MVQGHLDYEDDAGWFTGVGISQVSFDDQRNPGHADVEFKPYLLTGRPELSAISYIYNGKVFAHGADFAEFYGSLHYQDCLSGRVTAPAPTATT